MGANVMTTTPQAALLSDDEVAQCINRARTNLFDRAGTTSFRIARAIEQAVLAKLQARQEPVQAFPPRMMELLEQVSDRNPGAAKGPWEDAQGLPTQDDADAAISWIKARSVSTQEPAQDEPTLRDYADSLVEAGHDFWKACKREAGGGAVRWLSCDDGTLIVFTRGEYRDTIMENIGGYKAPEVFFEEDGITAAEAQEPAQAGELPDEREAFEAEMRCVEEWGHRSLKKRTNGKYENWQVDLMWDVWQARAALSARKPLSAPDRRKLWAKHDEVAATFEVFDRIVTLTERAHGIGLEVKP